MNTNRSEAPEVDIPVPAHDNVANVEVILSERTVPILVHGIVADAQRLIGQQLAMIRQEIRDDLRKAKVVIVLLAVGAVISAVGSSMLLVMLPLLLNWAVPELPLWACFGIIGGVLAALGGVLLYFGVRKIESIDLLSNQAVEAFKEIMTWKTKPT
jgi:hypothetical protein